MKKRERKIPAWYCGIFLLAVMVCFTFPASATIFTNNGTEIDESTLENLMQSPAPSDNTSDIQFFYDPECGACGPVHEYLDEYMAENPDTEVQSLNFTEGASVMDRFSELKAEYSREKVYIPVIFFGPVALEGTDDILTYFEDVYTWCMKST